MKPGLRGVRKSKTPRHSGKCVFKCKDGSFTANLKRLKKASAYFNAMFSHPSLLPENSEIDYSYTSTSVMGAVVRFLLLGKFRAELKPGTLAGVFAMAHMMLIPELVQLAYDSFDEKLSTENVFHFYQLCKIRDWPTTKFRSFTLSNECAKNGGMAGVMEKGVLKPGRKVRDVIGFLDDMQAPLTDEVAKTLFAWVDRSPNNSTRGRRLREIFASLDLQHLSGAYLHELLRKFLPPWTRRTPVNAVSCEALRRSSLPPFSGEERSQVMVVFLRNGCVASYDFLARSWSEPKITPFAGSTKCQRFAWSTASKTLYGTCCLAVNHQKLINYCPFKNVVYAMHSMPHTKSADVVPIKNLVCLQLRTTTFNKDLVRLRWLSAGTFASYCDNRTAEFLPHPHFFAHNDGLYLLGISVVQKNYSLKVWNEWSKRFDRVSKFESSDVSSNAANCVVCGDILYICTKESPSRFTKYDFNLRTWCEESFQNPHLHQVDKLGCFVQMGQWFVLALVGGDVLVYDTVQGRWCVDNIVSPFPYTNAIQDIAVCEAPQLL